MALWYLYRACVNQWVVCGVAILDYHIFQLAQSRKTYFSSFMFVDKICWQLLDVAINVKDFPIHSQGCELSQFIMSETELLVQFSKLKKNKTNFDIQHHRHLGNTVLKTFLFFLVLTCLKHCPFVTNVYIVFCWPQNNRLFFLPLTLYDSITTLILCIK